MNKHTSKECWALICMDPSSTSIWLLEILKCSWVSPRLIHVQILRTQYGNQWGRFIIIDAMPTCVPRKQIWLQGNFKSNYLLVISIYQFMCRCSTFLQDSEKNQMHSWFVHPALNIHTQIFKDPFRLAFSVFIERSPCLLHRDTVRKRLTNSEAQTWVCSMWRGRHNEGGAAREREHG